MWICKHEWVVGFFLRVPVQPEAYGFVLHQAVSEEQSELDSVEACRQGYAQEAGVVHLEGARLGDSGSMRQSGKHLEHTREQEHVREEGVVCCCTDHLHLASAASNGGEGGCR